jgi:hypothetical protein
MTDDRDGHDDAGDWFAAQFGSHDDAEEGADETADAPGPGAGEAGRAAEAAKPSESASEESPTPTTTTSGGGFNWGLSPTSPAAPTPPVPTVVPEPVAEAEPVGPPEPTTPPEPVRPPEPTPPAPVTPPQVSPFAPPPLVPLVQPEPLPSATSFFAPPPLIVPPATSPVVPPSEPQPFDAALAGGPSVEAEPPTMALPWEGTATELFAPPAASASVAEPATELLGGLGPAAADAAAGSSAEGSSVDALFGESQFREYQTGSLAAADSPAKPAPEKAPRAPIPRSQKVLFWIAGSLAVLLVLVGLFFLGTKLPRASSAPVAVTTPTASAKSTPSPTPTVLPVGPLAAGEYKWDRLLGGECLSPFTSPWVEKFTVVGCGTPHPAQMVARGVFVETPPAANNESAPATPAVGGAASNYPEADALQAQINLLCTTPGVIDFAAAGAYSDIQILGSYPATAKQWADGDRSYFCFVTRSSGEPITGSLAVPPAP